jgi:hypothetical protein
MALYLEPLYVARSAVVELDWRSVGDEVRSAAKVSARPSERGRLIQVQIPEDEGDELPEALEDVAAIDAELDAKGRLAMLDVTLRGEEGSVQLECEYDSKGRSTQPILVTWKLPTGEEVLVRTKIRREAGVYVPGARQVIFPSRFDPQETEEILVEYGTYELNPQVPDEAWDSPRSFRYDADGLVSASEEK